MCGPVRDGELSASIASLPPDASAGEPFTVHATARLRGAQQPGSESAAGALAQARARCGEVVRPEEHYAGFERRGLDFGPGFRVIRQLWRGESEAVAEVILDEQLAGEAARYRVHPVLLDGCLQAIAGALPRESPGAPAALYLPLGIGRYVRYAAAGARCTSHVTVRDSSAAAATRRADVRVFDPSGALVAEVRDLQLARVAAGALDRAEERWLDDALYEVVWREAPPPEGRATAPVADGRARGPGRRRASSSPAGGRPRRPRRARAAAGAGVRAPRRPGVPAARLRAGRG